MPSTRKKSVSPKREYKTQRLELRLAPSAKKVIQQAMSSLRWTGTAMLEAEKSFRRLKAHKQFPILRAALLRHQQALLGEPIAIKNVAA